MKKVNVRILSACLVLALFTVGCNAPAEDKGTETVQAAAAPDFEKIKAEIQAIENTWAAADNARDVQAILVLMGDDAITMQENKPAISGKAAIQKDYEEYLAKRTAGETVSYEVVELFGSEDQVTERGKSTTMDASGKVLRTGKYMAVWEKRDGKYVCIRDISTSDAKAN